jgi:hypothetical protein
MSRRLFKALTRSIVDYASILLSWVRATNCLHDLYPNFTGSPITFSSWPNSIPRGSFPKEAESAIDSVRIIGLENHII